MSGLKYKDFLSLNRHRRPRSSGMFQTLNSLDSSSPSTNNTSSPGVKKQGTSIFDRELEQIQHNRSLRNRLEGLGEKTPSKGSSTVSRFRKCSVSLDGTTTLAVADRTPKDILEYVLEERVVTDVFDRAVPILLNKLNGAPLHEFALKSVELDGNRILPGEDSPICICISQNEQFLYFTRGGKLIKGLVVNRESQIRAIKLSSLNRSMLVELTGHRGYLYATYLASDAEFVAFIRDNWTEFDTTTKFSNAELLGLKQELDILQEKSERAPQAPVKIVPIDPKQMYSLSEGDKQDYSTKITDSVDPDGFSTQLPRSDGRITRSSASSERINYAETDPTAIEDEPPIEFSPLTYEFPDSSRFTIYNSDFKTLYKDEFINDSLIDFFLKYEISQAVSLGKFSSSDICLLSSFFFNKLMNTPKEVLDPGSIDYYGNVKKWLSRIDLMSYPCVIIPINESLHWYCCMIIGLPQLLEHLLKNKEKREDSNGFDFENMPASEKGDEGAGGEADDISVIRDVKKVEIFLIDSLGKKHSNIHLPLKKFIMGYCKDKYGIEIPKESFRMVNARVPKQNDFYNCGPHVIFNARKWLSDNEECERLWKSGSSMAKYQSRKFFNASERQIMRKSLRDTLLKLQKEENKYEEGNWEEEGEDIEIIEVQHKPQMQLQSELQSQEQVESIIETPTHETSKNTSTEVDMNSQEQDHSTSETSEVESMAYKELLKTQESSTQPVYEESIFEESSAGVTTPTKHTPEVLKQKILANERPTLVIPQRKSQNHNQLKGPADSLTISLPKSREQTINKIPRRKSSVGSQEAKKPIKLELNISEYDNKKDLFLALSSSTPMDVLEVKEDSDEVVPTKNEFSRGEGHEDDPHTLILKSKVSQIIDFVNQSRTLDPSNVPIIQNKSVRREIGGKKLGKLQVDVLNQLYDDESVISKSELVLVGDFIDIIADFSPGVNDEVVCNELFNFLNYRSKERRSGNLLSLAHSTPNRRNSGFLHGNIQDGSPGFMRRERDLRRPKDESFTIRYQDLTDELLNESVSGLNLSENERRNSQSPSVVHKIVLESRESTTPESKKSRLGSSPLSRFTSPMGKSTEEFTSLFKSFSNKRRKLKNNK